MADISIILKGRMLKATLDRHSPSGEAIYRMLPIAAKINTWGDEIYFPLDIHLDLDSPVEVVTLGDIAYSRVYDAFCIFYGKTPISSDDEIIPNSPVDLIGRLEQDPSALKTLLSGFVRHKTRRMLNRIGFLKKFAETILIEKR